MRTPTLIALTAGILACAPQAPAGSLGQAVSVELRRDDGRTINLYPASGVNRVYAEAIQGAEYRILVHNRTGRRVGLCIAVDGRNIISGAKSWLRNDERMYILDPYASQEYAGWRTGQDRINRFFFTSADDTYAGAFNDTSAMGVVAVAVFSEVQRRPCPPPPCAMGSPGMSRREEAKKSTRDSACEPEAGTGYGREEYSPSRTVAFEPEGQPWERIFIKYEWRDTLRRLGVLRDTPPPRNRFWNDFAPPPPPRS
jgi:hypothetical protein